MMSETNTGTESAKLCIPITSETTQKKVNEAESALRDAGIKFDSGTELGGEVIVREWFFDHSLENADLVEIP